LEYRLDKLRLSGRSQKFVKRTGFTVLGDLHDKCLLDLRGAGPRVIGEFTSMIGAMTSKGPPEPGGLLDHLDAGLDALKERHRQVLLLRLGGTGEAPLPLAEIGRRLNITPERVRQVQGHALARLPAVAGPEFGAAFRDLEARVSVEGADVAAELGRSWRRKAPSTDGIWVPRPWASTGFYVRLLTKLNPGIDAAVFPPKVSQAATTTSDNQ
jgi:DNA-binding CsgD family transcriptional regulator